MIEEKGIDEQEEFLEFKQWDIANKTARVYRCGKRFVKMVFILKIFMMIRWIYCMDLAFTPEMMEI